jgi:hypothetical protein
VNRPPQPTYKPCSECGVAVVLAREEEHVCQEARRLDHQMTLLRPELARLEDEIEAFLASPQGAFALWCAERDRLTHA